LAGMGIARVIPSLIDDGPPNLWMSAAFGPILCGLLIMVWWLALSRATWKEKFAGIVGVVGIAAITLLAIDKSMRGPAVMVLTIPMGTAAFGIAAILFGRILSFRRTLLAILFAGMGFGFSALLKSDGMWGNFAVDLDWRWTHSPEDQILARQNQPPAANRVVFDRSDIEQWLMNPEWPGFRGADRASRQRGPVLAADWAANPPELIWKIGVGPGWSSFVVAGKLLFTQEQRGSMESVVCYAADSGREIWTQQIE
ncbi:MAG: alcohol dehydrogenase, partial [Planctomycetaceae bacterium]|nr:alcohol dehydrogenase [Planctomycetaceae bacterium]